eukprot:1159516-Pelagomonas_calceolata.AAC.13
MPRCELNGPRLNVAVLLSGGVDSSLALRLLVAAGHRCKAFYLQIWFQVQAGLGNASLCLTCNLWGVFKQCKSHAAIMLCLLGCRRDTMSQAERLLVSKVLQQDCRCMYCFVDFAPLLHSKD